VPAARPRTRERTSLQRGGHPSARAKSPVLRGTAHALPSTRNQQPGASNPRSTKH